MSIEPLLLDETSPGTFSLLLRDLDSFSSTFEAAGHSGDGYSWEAVARHLLESSLAEFEEVIALDSEADMFCAHGKDRDALEQLGAALTDAARSARSLKKLIATVPPSLWDD